MTGTAPSPLASPPRGEREEKPSPPGGRGQDGGAPASATLEVDLDAIAANWRLLRARHPSGPVAGVVKADGYGLGARPVAARLYREGCRHFFVAHLAEALAIRDLVPDALLAALNGLLPGSEAEHADSGTVPVLGSLAELDAWTATARALGRALPAILHLDTGLSRLGFEPREWAAIRDDPGRLAGLDLRYVMTHLVASEVPGDPINETQRERFAAACAALPGVPRSLANSSALFLGAAFGSDLARPGAALYGINPTPDRPNPMRPAVRLLARVLQVREIPTGATVGYNATWRAAHPSRVATVGIGYADGWHRSRSGRGTARFDGRPVPLIGRVSMDLTTYDVTGRPEIVPGVCLELIGPDLSPDTVAAAARTNGYEVLTSLGRRLARVYRAA